MIVLVILRPILLTRTLLHLPMPILSLLRIALHSTLSHKITLQPFHRILFICIYNHSARVAPKAPKVTFHPLLHFCYSSSLCSLCVKLLTSPSISRKRIRVFHRMVLPCYTV
eukprot:TRINITY_DN16273_c0_g1::TRINITY_DN16273_c0_g1_i1::g.3102::m.3102 TRINITY_DN16273_c0_g1::TRINITY_DN16273_c0_g1_i1::g.3102  ORF type:complete len:112 (+),score=-31.65,DUF902/PF06001.8/0.02,DUF902/PF06001.8/5.8e+02,Photo_RC/PF00124.14/0.027 TRINITY_DN16273_c0_g1_i1:415-750(+)